MGHVRGTGLASFYVRPGRPVTNEKIGLRQLLEEKEAWLLWSQIGYDLLLGWLVSIVDLVLPSGAMEKPNDIFSLEVS